MDIRSVPGPGPPASASAAGLCSERRLAFDFDFNGYCFVLNVPFLDASRILDLTIYLERSPLPIPYACICGGYRMHQDLMFIPRKGTKRGLARGRPSSACRTSRFIDTGGY